MIRVSKGSTVVYKKPYDQGWKCYVTNFDILFHEKDVIEERNQEWVFSKSNGVYYVPKRSCTRQEKLI